MAQNFLCDINNIINSHPSHGRFTISRNPLYAIWSDCTLFIEIASTHSLLQQVVDRNLPSITWSGTTRTQPYRGHLFDRIHELFKVREKLIKDILKSITTEDNKTFINDINNIILDHENCIVGPLVVASNREETRSNCPAFINASYPLAPSLIPPNNYQNICIGNLWDTIIPLHYHLQTIEYFLLFLRLLTQNTTFLTDINNIIEKHQQHNCKFIISQRSIFSDCPLLIEIASTNSIPSQVDSNLPLITWLTSHDTSRPYRVHVMVQIHELIKI
ncbi:3179_t:CDS:1 [Gigaspora margarita]|uniref:3179_t:CDS:1 n=1 Tax=Gigaspora margarita TaxID=4874 RepID=A0ABN7VA16_GIGMA|nr:3179_t:CDS:1 [Gigaspora margarita]